MKNEWWEDIKLELEWEGSNIQEEEYQISKKSEDFLNKKIITIFNSQINQIGYKKFSSLINFIEEIRIV